MRFMNDAGMDDGSDRAIQVGDRLMFDDHAECRAGCYVLARHEGRDIARQLQLYSDKGAAWVTLVPLNPDYATVQVPSDQVRAVCSSPSVAALPDPI